MPVLAADGCHVTTVEGIGSVKGGDMHPVQKAMTDLHGSQCGELWRNYDFQQRFVFVTFLDSNMIANHIRFLHSWNYCIIVLSLRQPFFAKGDGGTSGRKFMSLYRVSANLGCRPFTL